MNIAIITNNLAFALEHVPLNGHDGNNVEVHFTDESEYAFAPAHLTGVLYHMYDGCPTADKYVVNNAVEVLPDLPREQTLFISEDVDKLKHAESLNYDFQDDNCLSDFLNK